MLAGVCVEGISRISNSFSDGGVGVGPLWIFMELFEVTSGNAVTVAVEVVAAEVVAAAKLAWLVVVAVVFLVFGAVDVDFLVVVPAKF